MQILVVSDTHGHVENVIAHVQKNQIQVDEIWHLGDFYQDAATLGRMLHRPFVAVKGNCDVMASGPEELLLDRLGHQILLTHGHHYHVKSHLNSILFKQLEEEIDLVCFGHTHLALAEKTSGKILFNPGSPYRPALGKSPSVGLINITKKTIAFSLEIL